MNNTLTKMDFLNQSGSFRTTGQSNFGANQEGVRGDPVGRMEPLPEKSGDDDRGGRQEDLSFFFKIKFV